MTLDTVYLRWFDPPLLNLATTLTKQSLLKHVLTEGDKMLISALSSDEDQGVYAFVVNYGMIGSHCDRLHVVIHLYGRIFGGAHLVSTS